MLNLNFLCVDQAWRKLNAMDDATFHEAHGWQAPQARSGTLTLSLALGAAGVQVAGPMRVEAGPLAGRRVETGANRFARWFAGRHGAPECLSVEQGIYPVIQALTGRRGIVVFVDGAGPNGGSATVLDGHNVARACVSAMRAPVREVHFWALA